MFLTTRDINRTYMILGIVNATVKRTLTADRIDEVDQYDEMYNQVKEKLIERAAVKEGDGVIGVNFNSEIVRVAVGPKYMLLHGYGTAIKFPKK
ncbi:hypothetical protein [Liquorilactobacillus sucicola]|nr:hypothetical protein [Liquorilactobacillus sucicola]